MGKYLDETPPKLMKYFEPSIQILSVTLTGLHPPPIDPGHAPAIKFINQPPQVKKY